MARIKTYDEVWNKPLKSYQAVDSKGRKVLIQPKKPSKHGLNHPLEQTPALFYNLGEVILDPHDTKDSISKTPKAIADRKKGTIQRYVRMNFIKELDLPGYSTWKEDKVEVVVLYQADPTSKPRNLTKTYHVYKK